SYPFGNLRNQPYRQLTNYATLELLRCCYRLRIKKARKCRTAIIASPRPSILGAGRATTPPLVALAAGTLVQQQPDLDLFAAMRIFKLAAQAGQRQRGEHVTDGGDVAALRVERHRDDQAITHLSNPA